MLNLTSQYPNVNFLTVGYTQILTQVNTANSTYIPRLNFPKKYRRANIVSAPDNSGVLASQIDVLINSDARYAFQSLNDARNYGLQAANEMVNNPCFYIENVQPTYYQAIVWSVA